jgi:hypothetical protein
MADYHHNPERQMWEALTLHFDVLNGDPHNKSALENAHYYTDQWYKQCEKRVTNEIRAKKIKETAGDKLPKITPKADKLSQK